MVPLCSHFCRILSHFWWHFWWHFCRIFVRILQKGGVTHPLHLLFCDWVPRVVILVAFWSHFVRICKRVMLHYPLHLPFCDWVPRVAIVGDILVTFCSHFVRIFVAFCKRANEVGGWGGGARFFANII